MDDLIVWLPRDLAHSVLQFLSKFEFLNDLGSLRGSALAVDEARGRIYVAVPTEKHGTVSSFQVWETMTKTIKLKDTFLWQPICDKMVYHKDRLYVSYANDTGIGVLDCKDGRLLKTLVSRQGVSHFTVYQDQVLLTCYNQRTVQVITTRDQFVFKFGHTNLLNPKGILVLDDSIYVADLIGINEFTLNGTYIETFGTKKLTHASFIFANDSYIFARGDDDLFLFRRSDHSFVKEIPAAHHFALVGDRVLLSFGMSKNMLLLDPCS